MKTPIQELIEKIKFARKMCDDPSMEMDIYHTLDVLTSEAEAMLEKEKEVIMNAYTAGESDGTHEMNSALNYFNQTFNTKEK